MRKNIIKYYMYTLMHSLIFAYVIERLYWASKNMTVQDVVWTEVIYAVTIIALEIPTGMLADMFPRKWFLVINELMTVIELLILIFATSFWHFALAIMLAGVGKSLKSGAHNALLYDSLDALGEANRFDSILGRLNVIDRVGSLVAGLLGAFVAARYPMVTTYWMSFASVVIATFVLLTLKEVAVKQSHEPHQAKLKHHLSELLTSKHLVIMMASGILTASVITYVDEFWQLYLQAIQIDVAWFGMINVFSFLAFALGAFLLGKIASKNGKLRLFRVAFVLSALSLIIMGLVRSWTGVVLVLGVYLSSAVIEPILMAAIHDQVTSDVRASVESVYAMAERVGVILIGLPFGWIATQYSIFNSFIYLGALTLVAYLVSLFMIRRKTTTIEL